MKYLFLGLVILCGCSTKVVKKDKLESVKRIAVIGFDVQQQRPVSTGDLFDIATQQAKNSSAAPALATPMPHAENIYQDLLKQLSGKARWQVVTLDQLRKNPKYKEFLKLKMEGFQNRPMINDRFDLYIAPGVADSWAVMNSESSELKALAMALGVDAVAFVKVEIKLNANGALASLVGQGEYKPSGNTTLVIRDSVTGENIFSLMAEGDKVEKGEKNIVGTANEENLHRLAKEAAQISVKAVVNEL